MRRPEIQPSTPRFAERTAIATAAQPIRNRLLIALKREVVEFLRRGHPDTDPTGQLVLLSRVLVPLGKLHVRVHLNGRSRADSGERVEARFGGSDEADTRWWRRSR